MPFGVVSRVGRRMGVLDGGGYRQRGRDSFGVNVGHPIVTNGILCVRAATQLFPNFFGISCFCSLLFTYFVTEKYITNSIRCRQNGHFNGLSDVG